MSKHQIRLRLLPTSRPKHKTPLACDREPRAVTLQVHFRDGCLYSVTGTRADLKPLIHMLTLKPAPYPHHWPLDRLTAICFDPRRRKWSTVTGRPTRHSGNNKGARP